MPARVRVDVRGFDPRVREALHSLELLRRIRLHGVRRVKAEVLEQGLHRERLVTEAVVGARPAFDGVADHAVPLAEFDDGSASRTYLNGEEALNVRGPGHVGRANAAGEAVEVAPVVAAHAVAHDVGMRAVDAALGAQVRAAGQEGLV